MPNNEYLMMNDDDCHKVQGKSKMPASTGALNTFLLVLTLMVSIAALALAGVAYHQANNNNNNNINPSTSPSTASSTTKFTTYTAPSNFLAINPICASPNVWTSCGNLMQMFDTMMSTVLTHNIDTLREHIAFGSISIGNAHPFIGVDGVFNTTDPFLSPFANQPDEIFNLTTCNGGVFDSRVCLKTFFNETSNTSVIAVLVAGHPRRIRNHHHGMHRRSDDDDDDFAGGLVSSTIGGAVNSAISGAVIGAITGGIPGAVAGAISGAESGAESGATSYVSQQTGVPSSVISTIVNNL